MYGKCGSSQRGFSFNIRIKIRFKTRLGSSKTLLTEMGKLAKFVLHSAINKHKNVILFSEKGFM